MQDSSPTNQTLRTEILKEATCYYPSDSSFVHVDIALEELMELVLATFDTFIASVTEKSTENVGFTFGEGKLPLTQFQTGYNQKADEILEAYKQFRGNDG